MKFVYYVYELNVFYWFFLINQEVDVVTQKTKIFMNVIDSR